MVPDIAQPWSNADFEVSLFRPHGMATIWSHDSIVRFDVKGPFNWEFAESIAALNGKIYAQTAGKGLFVVIVIFRESMLMPIEAVNRLCESFREWRMRGCAPHATAWVVGTEVEGAFVMLPIFERKFRDLGSRFKHFDILDEAENWANAQLREI